GPLGLGASVRFPVVSFAGPVVPCREWRAALASPRLPHGWILSGRRGVGKASFALQAARELVAESGIPQPAGDHPDIIVLAPLPATAEDEKKRNEGKPYQLKRNISVDQVRSMQQCLTTRATLGSRRAIIIDPADDLEKGAANAALKSLEERPAGTFFFLVTHRIGRLLPTIRSRCRLLQLPQLDAPAIDSTLQREAPQAASGMRRAAVAAPGGPPRLALGPVEAGLGTTRRLMGEMDLSGDRADQRRGKCAEAICARPARKRPLAAFARARAVTTAKMRTVGR